MRRAYDTGGCACASAHHRGLMLDFGRAVSPSSPVAWPVCSPDAPWPPDPPVTDPARPPEVVDQPPTSEASSASPGTDIRRKTFVGIALLGGRGVAVRLLALAGNVALARLLTPSDFGAVALGLSVIALATLLSDGGLGAGLVRRREPPVRNELRALVAVQLVMTSVIGAAVATVGLSMGGIGDITAVMIIALPIVALRVPALITLERNLAFGRIALVEATEVLIYYTWALATVAAGFGVWGLATASIVKALAGTSLLLSRSPAGALRPLFSPQLIRPLLAFGVRFQAVTLAHTVRDQGVNLGTLAIAGPATLGLWTLASRVLQVPFLLFESLWRVAYPAMAQLVAAGEDVRRLIERGVRVASTATGLLLAALVSSTPALIPALFGERWAPASGVIPPACLALQISGPISVATAGYLFAIGRANAVLVSGVVGAAAWFAVTFPLLPLIGVTAVGVGWFVAALGEAVVLSRATRSETSARFVPQLAVSVTAATLAGTAGWLLTSQLAEDLGAAGLGAALGAGLYLVLVFLMRRALITELTDLMRRGLRSARKRMGR